MGKIGNVIWPRQLARCQSKNKGVYIAAQDNQDATDYSEEKSKA